MQDTLDGFVRRERPPSRPDAAERASRLRRIAAGIAETLRELEADDTCPRGDAPLEAEVSHGRRAPAHRPPAHPGPGNRDPYDDHGASAIVAVLAAFALTAVCLLAYGVVAGYIP